MSTSFQITDIEEAPQASTPSDKGMNPQISSYLTAADVSLMDSSLEDNVLWAGLFERIKKLHFGFEFVEPSGANFIDCYHKVLSSQLRERIDLVDYFQLNTNVALKHLKVALNKVFMKGGIQPPISVLEERHQALEVLNAEIIKQIIKLDKGCTMLVLDGCGITRLPQLLFDDPDPMLTDFLPTLELLKCTNTKIKYLPKGLVKCKQLKILECENNQIQFVPSLKGLTQLQVVSLSSNQMMHVDWNIFPEKVVPCLNNNKISQIPSMLSEKFGTRWYVDTKYSQIMDVDFITAALARLEIPKAYLPSSASDNQAHKRLHEDGTGDENSTKRRRTKVALKFSS